MSASPTDVVYNASGQFTQGSHLPAGTIFPNPSYQLLSSFVILTGLTVLTYCFARRTDHDGMWTWKGLREMSWPKICVVLIFADSWAFIFSIGILITGAGLSTNQTNCTLAIFSCIILYVGSKLFIYLFLIEKIYIVWAPHGTGNVRRLNTPIFKICIGLLLPLLVVLLVMIWGRVAMLRQTDRVCVIGLRKAASLTLLCYDLFMTLVLTTLFVVPLLRDTVSPRLRKVAARTLVASCVALLTSCANIAILTVLHGKELGWICLTSCGTDVTINALAIYWVTNTSHVARPMNTPPAGPGVTNSSGNQSHGVVMSPGAEGYRASTMRIAQKGPGRVSVNPKAVVLDGQSSAVPVEISSARVTHFADEPVKSDPESLRSPGDRPGRWFFGGVKGAFKARSAPVEEHGMSVQVTVTTDHQIHESDDDDDRDSCKYPRAESDVSSFPAAKRDP